VIFFSHFINKVFLHDFQAGKSPEAMKILEKRKQGVTSAAKYASFLVGKIAICYGTPRNRRRISDPDVVKKISNIKSITHLVYTIAGAC
jgi:hypothetical protein